MCVLCVRRFYSSDYHKVKTWTNTSPRTSVLDTVLMKRASTQASMDPPPHSRLQPFVPRSLPVQEETTLPPAEPVGAKFDKQTPGTAQGHRLLQQILRAKDIHVPLKSLARIKGSKVRVAWPKEQQDQYRIYSGVWIHGPKATVAASTERTFESDDHISGGGKYQPRWQTSFYKDIYKCMLDCHYCGNRMRYNKREFKLINGDTWRCNVCHLWLTSAKPVRQHEITQMRRIPLMPWRDNEMYDWRDCITVKNTPPCEVRRFYSES
jgi:hypothetical protein